MSAHELWHPVHRLIGLITCKEQLRTAHTNRLRRSELIGQLTPIFDTFNSANICNMLAHEVDHEVQLILNLVRVLELEMLLLELQLYCTLF